MLQANIQTSHNAVASPIVPGIVAADLMGESADPATLVLLAFLEPQLTGEHPFAGTVKTESDDVLVDSSSVLPGGAELVRHYKCEYEDVSLAIWGDLWVYSSSSKSGIKITVSGSDPALVDAGIEEIRRLLPEPPKPDESTVPIHIWHRGPSGGSAQRRRLEVPQWAEITRNYPPAVRMQLNELMELERPAGNGRLILWHGAPGTGKTTAIRALMTAWAKWCDAQYVIDPEVAFADPGYLTDLMTRKFDDHGRGTHWIDDDDDLPGAAKESRWRLIIAEDSDEFLRADARQSAGAALGRLLNLSDGILGQGSNTLILLTTNEDMRELHPALVRPGRALAKTEFLKFGVSEANEWLDGAGSVGNPKTLAELYELLGDIKRIGNPTQSPPRIGFGI